ncbi:MAG: DNA-directed RNA polymerase subunit alpha [Chloroflexota bacterium]|nr:DNA-directed RNA polymerase subunit alpha [Chloroflexota bacterium]
MIETTFQPRGPVLEGETVVTPEIKVLEASDTYGKFVLEPLEEGFGTTLGSPLRRVLLSSIPGTAITWVKIDDVLNEYQTIPDVKEEVMDFLLNVKGIRIRSVTGRPGKMRLEVSGEGRVCAGDIATSSDFEIVNPEHLLGTLNSEKAKLTVEFNVEQDTGYRPSRHGEGLPVGILPVDAIFTPVRRVNYAVERTRVGQKTNYERLVLEVWTDGTTTPLDAVKIAAKILVDLLFLFSGLSKDAEAGAAALTPSSIPADIYQMPIEKLELTPRTMNCLKRAHITKVGQVLELGREGLLKIRNFGEKSLEELYDKMRAQNLLSEDEAPKDEDSSEDDTASDEEK